MSVQSEWQEQQLEKLEQREQLERMLAEAEAQEQQARAEWQSFMDKYQRLRRKQQITRWIVGGVNTAAAAWNLYTGAYLLLPINALGFLIVLFSMRPMPEDPLELLKR